MLRRLARRKRPASTICESIYECQKHVRTDDIQAVIGSLPHCQIPCPTIRETTVLLDRRQESLLQGRSVSSRVVFGRSQSADLDLRLLENPIKEVFVPHVHKIEGEGDSVPGSYCLPPNASASNPVPLVLIITGLDGYRTELAVWSKGWAQKGVATLIHEIPGTGDSPALRQDPTSPDRQWKSVLDWVGQQKELDSKKVIVWGFSTGGYYALRVAHTEKDRLLASISLGGGAHHMFDREWLENVNKLEYPFDLAGTLTYKFGYKSLEDFINDSAKYSLLNDGTLAKPCCRMLLVNGNDDEIFPIDDMFVALENGMPKEARMVKGKKHMGEPDSFFIILKWIYNVLGLQGDIMDQMKTLPSRSKY